MGSGNGKDISSDRPGNMPDNIFEGVQDSLIPTAGNTVVGPQNDSSILRAAGNHRPRKAYRWSPCGITYPVRVTFQFSFFNPFLVLTPNFNEVIATTTDESFDWSRFISRRRIKGCIGTNGWSPTHRITTNSVSIVDLFGFPSSSRCCSQN